MFGKFMAAAAIAFLSFAQAATAQEAAVATKVEFTGKGVITAVSAACAKDGWAAGYRFDIALRPAGFGANGTRTGFSVLFENYAMGFDVPGDITKKFKKASASHLGAGGSYGPITASVRFTKMAPKTTTETSEYVFAELVIKGWGGRPKCVATIQASGIRKR